MLVHRRTSMPRSSSLYTGFQPTVRRRGTLNVIFSNPWNAPLPNLGTFFDSCRAQSSRDPAGNICHAVGCTILVTDLSMVNVKWNASTVVCSMNDFATRCVQIVWRPFSLIVELLIRFPFRPLLEIQYLNMAHQRTRSSR